MGCKGPETYKNCPVVRWNEGTNWPIGCGHPCVGCAEPNFWDTMTPFYKHLSGVPGFGVASDVDKLGVLAHGRGGRRVRWARPGAARRFAGARPHEEAPAKAKAETKKEGP